MWMQRIAALGVLLGAAVIVILAGYAILVLFLSAQQYVTP